MAKQQTQEVATVQHNQLSLPTGDVEVFDFGTEAPSETQLTCAELLDVDQFILTGYEYVDTRYGRRVVWHILLPEGPASFSMGIVTDESDTRYQGKMNIQRIKIIEWFDQHPTGVMTGVCLIALPVANGNDAYQMVPVKDRALRQQAAQRVQVTSQKVEQRLPDHQW